MATPQIKLTQIKFWLENEARTKKSLPLLANIEELLSKTDTELYWDEIPGVFSSLQATVDQSNKVIANEQSILLKLFAHRETYEIRQFVAKFTDSPETLTLPG